MLELFVGQGPRFVQDARVRVGFAHVVQQACHARLHGLFGTEVHFSCQRHHQAAHRDRMQIGVVVRGLEARHADQCVRVAFYGAVDGLYQGAGRRQVQRMPHACFAEHAHYGIAGFVAYGRCPRHLLVQRRWSGVGGKRGQDGVWQCILCVQTLAGINPQFFNRAGTQLGQYFGGVHQKSSAPKIMRQPWPTQGVHIHSSLQLFDTNLFEHERG